MQSMKQRSLGFYDKLRQSSRLISYRFDIAVLLACTAYLILTIKYFVDSDVSYPVFDIWFYITELIGAADRNNLLAYVVSQANEHRPVLSFLAMSIDYFYFGFNLHFIKIFHLLSYGALVLFIIWLSGQITNGFDRSIRNSAKVLISASGLFFLLSMRQWEIHYGYTNVGTIQGFLFFVCSVYLYNKRFDWRAGGEKVTFASLAAALAFALLSTTSMAFGLLTLPFIFVISIVRGAEKKESLVLALLACMFFVIYGIDMNFAPADNAEWRLYPTDIIRIIYFSVLLPGSVFIANKPIALLIGLAGMVTTSAISFAVMAKKQNHRTVPVTIYCLLLLSISYSIMVGIGRRHMPDEQAMASRYMLAAAIYWQSLIALSLWAGIRYFSKHRDNILLLFRFVIISSMIVLFAQQKIKYDHIMNMARKNSVAVNALQFGILDRDTFPSYQIVDINEFYSAVKTLKDHQTSIYGTPIAKLYGQKISDKYAVDNNRCAGDITDSSTPPIIKQLVSDPSTSGLKLSGRAWNKQPGTVLPSRILLTDRQGIIKGAGEFTASAVDAGWVAFARLEKDATATDVNVYALYEKENVVSMCKQYIPPGQLNR